jgi:hypothetical protein
MRIALLAAVGLVACGSSPVGRIRFRHAAPVWRVDDQRPLASIPEKRTDYRVLDKLDNAFTYRATRAMELRDDKPALDVNSLDEVPDSTWFTNRIGIRDLSLDELKRGPNLSDSPFDHRPWTITGAKIGGVSLGFTFEDSTKRKFLLKFDMKEYPEAETAAHIIVHRILWGIGYNVAEDHLGYIQRRDLVVGSSARKKGIDDAKLDEALQRVYRRQDGSIRVLTSQFVPGTPLGPYPREGVRDDDANDRIPHERRRSLRGQYPIVAWLDHADLKEAQTVDSFHDGYVTHYLVDFGKALGVMGMTAPDPTIGHRYRYDVPSALADFVTLGLRRHSWDGKHPTGLRGVGLFDTAHFDPGRWKTYLPYWPIVDKDRFDAFWGAKLLMRFKPHELAAIVEQAQLTDPRSAKYLVDTLVARQRMTARYWFDRVAPLDAFVVEQQADKARLCFTDLTLAYALRSAPTTYAVRAYDHDGKAISAAIATRAGDKGRTCTAVALAPRADNYTIVHLQVRRNSHAMPPVVVHLARDSSGILMVVGLRRR